MEQNACPYLHCLWLLQPKWSENKKWPRSDGWRSDLHERVRRVTQKQFLETKKKSKWICVIYIFREINLYCGTVYSKDELLEVGGESIYVDWRGEGADQSLHEADSWKMESEKVTWPKGLFSLFTSTFFLSFIFLQLILHAQGRETKQKGRSGSLFFLSLVKVTWELIFHLFLRPWGNLLWPYPTSFFCSYLSTFSEISREKAEKVFETHLRSFELFDGVIRTTVFSV